MNVLIVEDETAAYKNMVTALQTIDSTIKIVGNTESVSQTVEWLQNNPQPDLIYMKCVTIGFHTDFFLHHQFKTVAQVLQADTVRVRRGEFGIDRIGYFQFAAVHPNTYVHPVVAVYLIVPLGEELAFIRSFMHVMEVRFEGKLTCSIDVPEKDHELMLPVLSLLPLIENVTVHNQIDSNHSTV